MLKIKSQLKKYITKIKVTDLQFCYWRAGDSRWKLSFCPQTGFDMNIKRKFKFWNTCSVEAWICPLGQQSAVMKILSVSVAVTLSVNVLCIVINTWLLNWISFISLQAFADALLVIPKILAQNSGYDPQETIVKLQVKTSCVFQFFCW